MEMLKNFAIYTFLVIGAIWVVISTFITLGVLSSWIYRDVLPAWTYVNTILFLVCLFIVGFKIFLDSMDD